LSNSVSRSANVFERKTSISPESGRGGIVLSKQTDVEWISIWEIINQKPLLDAHKAIQRVSPPVFHYFFIFLNHGKNTRGDGCSLIVPRIKTEAGRKTFLKFQGCKLFNELAKEMKTEKSIVRFKRKLSFLSKLFLVSSFYLF
jgi:hypothetical protein